jgi:hypothetical protein
MPFDHYSIATAEFTPSEQIDLQLALPGDIDLAALFPKDRLFRLHPNWFINEIRYENDRFAASVKDYVTDESLLIEGQASFQAREKEILTITIEKPLQIIIRFFSKNDSLHVQTFTIGGIEGSDPIILWIRAIREYIRLYTRKTPVTLAFRLLMNKMVLQMSPSQRKICMMLTKITLVEILVIILIVLGYKIFVI